MPRPVLRTPGGRWSLSQVYTEAGITLAVARTVVRQGRIDPSELTEDDVVVLRVAAALLEAPRPLGMPRNQTAETVRKRDDRALALTRDALASRSEHPMSTAQATLAVFPADVIMARTSFQLMAAVEEQVLRGDAALLLPVGAWIAALRSNEPVGRAG
jgi:hypothetical protein